MVVEGRGGSKKDGEEEYASHRRGQEHGACGGGAYEHAVPHEGSHARHGYGYRPGQILGCGGKHRSVVGEERQECVAPEGVDGGVGRGEDGTPHEQAAHRGVKARAVASAGILAAESLAGIGKAVHDVREEREELHEQGVDGKHNGALRRSCRHEEQVHGNEKQGAEEDVAVDVEEPHESLAPRDSPERQRPEQAAVLEAGIGGSNQQSAPLGYERARGHAVNLHPQPIDQGETRHDVHNVLHDAHRHGYARVLQADEPPREGVEAEHGGSAPHADLKIGPDERLQRRLHAHDAYGQGEQGALKHEHGERHGKRHAQAAHEKKHGLGAVATAVGLRRHAACAHAQEAEHPIDDVEQHAAHGNGGYVGGVAEVACYRHVNQSEQRNRDVCHYCGKGNVQNFLVFVFQQFHFEGFYLFPLRRV